MATTVSTSVWNGAGGILGYTKFRWFGELTASEASTALAKHRAFFAGLGIYIPTGVSVSFNSLMEHYDGQNEKTGTVTAGTPAASVTGTATGAYNAAGGAWVTWRTGKYSLGRPVTGRTFIVPIGATGMQSDGTPVTGLVNDLNSAAAAIVVGFPDLMIFYHHTKKDGREEMGETKVTSGQCRDIPGVLRSRRVGI